MRTENYPAETEVPSLGPAIAETNRTIWLMVAPSNTPSESEIRVQDCLAKAAYCKWVTGVTTDERLRDWYAEPSVAWEKEATELKGAAK
jgi:hypothetical protein